MILVAAALVCYLAMGVLVAAAAIRITGDDEAGGVAMFASLWPLFVVGFALVRSARAIARAIEREHRR